jgi:CHASE3 domain sensor protein
MERRITQETFDAVVQENEEDFGMGREEALRDAIQQFRSQAVDLSSIDVGSNMYLILPYILNLIFFWCRHLAVSGARSLRR